MAFRSCSICVSSASSALVRRARNGSAEVTAPRFSRISALVVLNVDQLLSLLFDGGFFARLIPPQFEHMAQRGAAGGVQPVHASEDLDHGVLAVHQRNVLAQRQIAPDCDRARFAGGE